MTDQQLVDALAVEVLGLTKGVGRWSKWYYGRGVEKVMAVADWRPLTNPSQPDMCVRKAKSLVLHPDDICQRFKTLLLSKQGTVRDDELLTAHIDHPNLLLQACLSAVREVRNG